MQKNTITLDAESPTDAATMLAAMMGDIKRITQLVAECHPGTQSVFAPFLAEVGREIARNMGLILNGTQGGAA